MIDTRLRNISFKLDGTWYLVTFRARLFGRVSDVKIRESRTRFGYYYPCDAKIDPQDTTACEALAMFWGAVAQDTRTVLRRVFRRVLSKR